MLFIYRFIAIILLSQSYCLFSVAQSKTTLSTTEKQTKLKNVDFNLDVYFGGYSFVEAQDDFKMGYLSAEPEVDFSVTDSFGVRGQATLNVVTGRFQTRFQNPSFNFFNIQEAIAYYEPNQNISLEVGAIDQEHFQNKLFIDNDRSFLGAKIKGGYVSEKLSFEPKAQYAIPSSTSLESDRTEAEELPTLTSYGFEASWKPRSWFSASANVNYFEFENLPSVVACRGQRLGNSVVGIDCSESTFRYDFRGISQFYNIEFRYIPSLSQEFLLGSVDNTAAPSDRSRSQWMGTRFNYDYSDSLSLRPEYGRFYAESDSTPALYSEFNFGRNNRDGFYVGFEANLKDLGMKVKTSYIEAPMIEYRPLQGDLQIFELFLEFDDVVVL